jgi:hemin uptake protein HemP
MRCYRDANSERQDMSAPHDPVPARIEPRSAARSAGEASAVGKVPTVSSAALFGGAPELWIDHGGTIYRLRLTSLGKLILTK